MEHGAERNSGLEYFRFHLTVMVVHMVTFGLYPCRYTQVVPKALVVLGESGYIIAFVYLIHDRRIVADVLVSHSGSNLYVAVPFLVELVVRIIIIALVRFRLSVVPGRIRYVRQPEDEITGNLSTLYAVRQITWQSVAHHPRDEITTIDDSGVGEDVAQGSEYPVHGIFQIIVDQTETDADQCRVERTVIAVCYTLYSLGIRSYISRDVGDEVSLTGFNCVVGTTIEAFFDLV